MPVASSSSPPIFTSTCRSERLRPLRPDDRVWRSVRPLLHRPGDKIDTVLDVVRAFWRAGFGEMSRAQRHARAHGRAIVEARLRHSFARGLTEISPRGVFDGKGDRLFFMGGQGTKVIRCQDLDVIEVMPSLWLRRRVVLGYAPSRLGISLTPMTISADTVPAEQMPAVLGTLGDPRRFEILRLCTARARTTTELAELLDITEGPVSRHLKGLERHGLVVGQRYGRHVTYAAVPEVMALVGRQLQRLPSNVAEETLTRLSDSGDQDRAVLRKAG
jgi:DNA-binding transcriptional ArsR family regulator